MSQDIQTLSSSVPGGDTGTSMTSKLNAWRLTILSLLSGTTRPTAAQAGTLWLDTSGSPWLVKLYNGTSDVTLFQVDQTNLRPIFPGAVPWVDGGGTGNAITAAYSPAIGSLIDGLLLGFRATAINTSATPTFSPNGLTAKTVVKNNGAALAPGDIAGDSHEVLLRYASDIDKWVLTNPRQGERIVALTDGTTPALDASLGDVFTLEAAGNRTIAVPTNPRSGQKIVIQHTASGANRTLSLNTGTGGFRFGTDIAELTATESGKTDYIAAIYNVTANKWDVVAVSKGYA